MNAPSEPPPARDWRRPAIYGSFAAAVALILFLGQSGFEGVVITRRGEVWTYALSWLWLPIVATPVALMAVCAAAGLTLPGAAPKFAGSVFLFFAVGMAVTAIPSLAACELVVTPEGFTHVAGFAWAPDPKTVRFRSLASIAVVPDPGDRGSFVLECRGRNGGTVAIPESTLLKAGLGEILVRAARAGVPIDRGAAARF